MSGSRPSVQRSPTIAGMFFAVVVLSVVGACAPPSPTGSSSGAAVPAGATSTRPARTLVAAVRNEPSTLASLPLGQQGGGAAVYFSKRMFNADLSILDGDGVPRPYLAEALPQLNTASWQVFPDGRMETTHRLKDGVRWHNGNPLTADDFVFSWRVYATPAFGHANSAPISLMEDVSAPDPRTIVIKWKAPYPQADTLQNLGTGAKGLPPLPQAVLGPTFEGQSPEALVNNSFWTQSYIGLGPYRLEQWQPGAFIEATAFEQPALKTPNILRIRVLIIPDGNTVLANMVSGDVQLAADVALPLGFVPEVMQAWGPGKGTSLLHLNQWRTATVQLRPDIVGSQALIDPRVRRALAYAVDKEGTNAATWAGQAIPSDVWIAPNSETGRVVDAAATKYPHDIRLAEQQMATAGYLRTGSGYAASNGARVAFDVMTNASPNNESEMSIIAAGWRQAGFDVKEAVLPSALGQDNEARSTFTGIFVASTNVGEQTAVSYATAYLARPENRWAGLNRGGYSEPSYDVLVDSLGTTLDRQQRAQLLAQMGKIFTDDLPSIPVFFQPQPWVFVNELKGLRVAASETNMSWNMREWEFN